MLLRRSILFLLIIAGIITSVVYFRPTPLPPPAGTPFELSYLRPAAGIASPYRRNCTKCHQTDQDLDPQRWKFLKKRTRLSPSEWAYEANARQHCGMCHLVPDPAMLADITWADVFPRMAQLIKTNNLPELSRGHYLDLLHYYFAFSPDQLPALPPDPNPTNSPLRFTPTQLGNTNILRPVIGNVKMVDLDGDSQLEVLVSNSDNSRITVIQQQQGKWQERLLANVPSPSRAEVITNTVTGFRDIVVACQDRMEPTDQRIGSVVLLRNISALQYQPQVILTNMPRISDVQPVDLNGDGRVDFLVAAFGYIKSGEMGWLEGTLDNDFAYHQLGRYAGVLQMLPADLNGDGKMDFITITAQQYELITAHIGNGRGTFTDVELFRAATPSYGLSGMSLVDLDDDGDTDILFTNGDNMDLPSPPPRPYHGVQWLENLGGLKYQWRDIGRFYGAYCGVAGDLDGDRDLDVVVTSMFNDWSDPNRAGLVWFQNDGSQNFTMHTIGTKPIALVTAVLHDYNKDGALDILTGGFHAFPPFTPDVIGRVTIWSAQPQNPSTSESITPSSSRF